KNTLHEDLHKIYNNLISGFELDLETAQLIRQNFRGPIYCDLHSLLLAVQPDGMRTLQPLPNAAAWMRCFDFIQVNEDEMSMMASDPMALAAIAMAEGVSSIAVTLGSRGVVYFATAGFERIDDLRRGSLSAPQGAIRTARVPAKPARHGAGDPTGCGDVWGATYFSRLLAGDKLDAAIDRALDAAARNVDHRGATGLADYLRGELSIK
ncbi:MAG: carbohydrate kinase family protein, partial [Gemmatimonadaceae bacterium]